MLNSNLVIVPSFSLEPNKLVLYNQVFVRHQELETLTHIAERKKIRWNKRIISNHKSNFKNKHHNFKLSDHAYRNLKRKINWLYYLAKSRYVKTYSGKEIYNFKINFISLTLPSRQKTPTQEVTNTLLNNFLTEIRRRTNMENYVWRLEFQQNGNVHYHIVTDTYLDYFFLLKIWNRILNVNGYIEPYTKKFEKLSLSEYNKLTNPNGKTPFNVIAKRYAKGKKTKWTQPNSVDVRSVVSKKAISFYISKYFFKDPKGNTKCNELDTVENSSQLRLWYCSRSLSKLKSISNFCEAVKYDVFCLISGSKSLKRVFKKYATVIYYEVSEIYGQYRKIIEILFKDYSKRQGYIPSS